MEIKRWNNAAKKMEFCSFFCKIKHLLYLCDVKTTMFLINFYQT